MVPGRSSFQGHQRHEPSGVPGGGQRPAPGGTPQQLRGHRSGPGSPGQGEKASGCQRESGSGNGALIPYHEGAGVMACKRKRKGNLIENCK